jgi:hypothetical protein
LMLSVSPPSPSPIGATTGTTPAAIRSVKI